MNVWTWHQRGIHVLLIQNCDRRSDVCQHFFLFARLWRRRRGEEKQSKMSCSSITVSPLDTCKRYRYQWLTRLYKSRLTKRKTSSFVIFHLQLSSSSSFLPSSDSSIHPKPQCFELKVSRDYIASHIYTSSEVCHCHYIENLVTIFE